MILEVDRYFLEINSLKALKDSNIPNLICKLELQNPPDFQLNKFFYKQIGKKHKWTDRLQWNDKKWIDYTNNSCVKTYVLREKDDLIGYFEQIFDSEKKECEIAYLGVLDNYIGKRFGGYLLSQAIKMSFLNDNIRTWVHTCTLDHKNALNNYKARGMKIFKTQRIKLNSS